MTRAPERLLVARLAGQGFMLSAGLTLAQLFALLRNAILGHILSKGDFGIGASLTLTLQILENASDMAADRLIVQSRQGDEQSFVNTAHAIMFIRGCLIGFAIWISAPMIADLFHLPDAAAAFRWIALIPVIKGLAHLDYRRMQRHYQNLPAVVLEVTPQALALAIAYPAAVVLGDYHVIVVISILQAAAATIASHITAKRTWGMNFESEALHAFLRFGWPVLLSAIPMIAIYQFDRVVIGHYLGMEDLAAYTAVFMLTMAPGLIVVKVASNLMLPLLAEAQDHGERFARRFAQLTEFSVVIATLYLVAFIVCGHWLVSMTFGAKYAGLGLLTALLATTWFVRILTVTSGVAMLARGNTKSILATSTIRATSLFAAFYAVLAGYGLTGIAAAGIVGDVASAAYLTWLVHASKSGNIAAALKRYAFALPVAAAAILTADVVWGSLPLSIVAMLALATTAAASALALMPALRQSVFSYATPIAIRIRTAVSSRITKRAAA